MFTVADVVQQLNAETVQRILDAFWNLFTVAVLSWLVLLLIKRLDDDFPTGHNFKLVHRQRPFLKKELWPEVGIALFNAIFTAPLIAVLSFVVVEYFLTPNLGGRLFATTIETWPFAVQLIVGLVVMDFSLYIRHRFVHEFFWNYHTVHHSTREITWITWLKLHPLDMVVMGLIDVVVMYFLGFDGVAIGAAGLVKFHFNRFCHSNIALDYGFPLRYVFCSPNMHRWHHAADDPEAINKNYCIVFAWIDLLFGTFYVPKGRLPKAYGVWDDEGRDVVGTGFTEMMLYPFREDWKGIKRLIRGDRTSSDSPPDE